jgi:2-dehydro-3-deoxyphosphogluconate aldolase/(4S)-4-hydroxy-2-oxoglutarate aldolase
MNALATLTERLEQVPVVPLIQADDPAVAVATAQALLEGGLSVLEVVLRTPEAMACLRQVAEAVPQAIVGAGTVLSADQARDVVDAGAAFVVSPGLDDAIVEVAQRAGLPVYPGVATATELQRACNLGLDAVKFFPASLCGGINMLKALGSVFRKVCFMPTGGISANNLADYLALPSVIACGGSWLTPASEISAGNFAAVTRLAQEALSIARQARGE